MGRAVCYCYGDRVAEAMLAGSREGLGETGYGSATNWGQSGPATWRLAFHGGFQ